jgi:sec-independent protein translocase protein TatB
MIGGLSMTEVIIILGLALLLLGPDQLPTIAKSIGKGLREMRKVTDDLKGQFEQEIARIDIDEQPQRMIAPVPAPPDDPAAARASARTAASAPPPSAGSTPSPAEGVGEPPAESAGAPPADDPAAARAAARRAAADSAKLKLVPPAGAVPREDA